MITNTDALALTSAEGEVLAADATLFAQSVRDPTVSARYERLASAALSGTVPGDLIGSLQTMLELLFEKGRRTNRAVLQSIYARTPRGHQTSTAARDANRALESLRGQKLIDIRISATPARHSLVIETEQCRLTLELDSSGARITSLEAG